MKKVAIIGSGISGVSAAYYLNKLGYEVSLFEAGSYFGGHTNTRDVNIDGTLHHVDTGFLVHNNRTYPNLINFFDELEIETHPSEMSFSVMRLSDNLTWAGSNLMTVFAQTKNIFRPRFYSFLKEVLRFNKNAQAYLEESKQRGRMSLGELLVEKGYSQDFQDWYLLPMGGCIWSSPTTKMLDFPAYTFLTFCQNHGLLQIFDRPQWKTVVNGCQTYVKKALSGIERKFLNEAVLSVHKEGSHLIVKTAKREEAFDYCFFCTHPPQTLEILKDSEKDLEACLQKFLYQPNTAVLHMDESILPKKKSVWSAWNYLSAKREDSSEAVSVSYLINKLQELVTKKAVIVTLNPSVPIKKEKTVEVIQYEHPLFSAEAVEGQEQMKKMQGRNNVYFSGAWMRYGFHEDGILSTKEAINAFLRNENKKSEQLEIL